MRLRVALGIDLGTSGVKVALVDGAGTVQQTASRTYPVLSSHPGWAETDPLAWERATQEAVAELLSSLPNVEVVAIGVAGQMHGTVLVDEHCESVRPAVLWPDSRAIDQMSDWAGLPERLRARLANPLTPGMPGPVLGWVQEYEPDVFARADAFMMPKDWLRSRLVSAGASTDPSDASATLLWDVPTDGWAVEVSERLGVPLHLLPHVQASQEPAGTLTPAAGARWGLPPGIPVSTGCGDVAGTLLGLLTEPNRTILTVGTGAQLVLPGVAPSALVPVTHHLYRDAENGWFALGAIMNAGLALSRVVELLGVDWDRLYSPRDLDAPVPGFVPYFAGERLPAGIRAGGAGWFDVGLETTRDDLLAAALEGVAFTIRRCLAAMPAADEVVDLVGGGTRSPVFNQLLADVLSRPLRRRRQRDATMMGAARLGWMAAGETYSLEGDTLGPLVEPQPSAPLEDRYARFMRHSNERESEGGR